MTIDDLVKRYYTEKIKRVITNEAACKYVLEHPRIEKCREALMQNIKLTELTHARRLNRQTIKMLAEDFGMFFARTVLNQKEHEIKSDSEKLRLAKEQEEYEYIMENVARDLPDDDTN